MEVEFKEKPYEGAFASEIARLTTITFSPDQCDEAFLGFDGAYGLPLPWLGRFAPYRRSGRWRRMAGISLHEFEGLVIEQSRRMPHFKFNLFVQYKRPVHLTTRGAAQWSDWRKPYYRYTITPHQQRILDNLQNQCGDRAATIYASPAFWRASDLWSAIEEESVVEKSNIASVERLQNHGSHSYVLPGSTGKGHSDVSDIESPPFERIIADGLDRESQPLNTQLKEVAQILKKAVESGGSASDFRRVRDLLDGRSADGGVADALATIEAFSQVYQVSYYAMG